MNPSAVRFLKMDVGLSTIRVKFVYSDCFNLRVLCVFITSFVLTNNCQRHAHANHLSFSHK